MHRIVVVDDEYIVVEGIKAMIRRAGLDYQVVGAAYDGISALDLIREERPDIVITDIRIPGLDGLSLIEALKEYLPETVFIVISGYMEFEYARRALSLGVRGYIDKPITIEKIKEILFKVASEEEKSISEGRGYLKKEKLEEEYSMHLHQMLDQVLREDGDAFLETGQEVLALLRELSHDPGQYKTECFEFLSVISGVFQEHRKEYGAGYAPSYAKLDAMSSLQEMEAYAGEILDLITADLLRKCHASSHRTIKQVLRYIDDHYSRDIGLTELADLVKLNPAYLSILFKEEVGQSYIKYLTSVRIKKSKELLLLGHKVSVVSGMVGYSNYRYFCDIFKKHVGQTPNEFKGNTRKKND